MAHAVITRIGKHWFGDTESANGTRLEAISSSVAGAKDELSKLLAAAEGVEQADVVLEVQYKLDDGIEELVEDALNDRAELRAVSRRAASSTARAVHTLIKDAGLTYRDAADLLGMSHQRVSQLANDPGELLTAVTEGLEDATEALARQTAELRQGTASGQPHK